MSGFDYVVILYTHEGSGSPVGTGSHLAIMTLYSWPLGHTQRKEPSTFTHWASPHTLLSSSHSFTSVEEEETNMLINVIVT